jgi:hypothetical protein
MTTDSFFTPLLRSLEVIASYLPRLFALLFILALGFILARLVRAIAAPLFRVLRVDQAWERLGLAGTFAGLRLARPPSALLADGLWGLVALSFFVVGLDALDPASGGRLLADLYAYLPRILVAGVVLAIGWAISVFAAQSVLVGAVNAGSKLGRPASVVVQCLVVAVALAMALEQLAIAQGIVTAAFAVAFGGIVLAFALAFGLGGSELARKMLETRLSGGANPAGSAGGPGGTPPPAAKSPDDWPHV